MPVKKKTTKKKTTKKKTVTKKMVTKKPSYSLFNAGRELLGIGNELYNIRLSEESTYDKTLRLISSLENAVTIGSFGLKLLGII